MLRAPLLRSSLAAPRSVAGLGAGQWQRHCPRFFADSRKPDQIVLPGAEVTANSDALRPPVLSSVSTTIPKPPPTPPTPAEVSANPPASPPPGAIKPVTAPSTPPPPPPKKKRRIRRFFTTLFLLSTLGFAGGVYYSLVSDNFHDFFTEYVPFGEDAVAYFEEREFRRRFPSRPVESKSYPQIRGENKITVGRQSGLSAREVDQSATSDLGKAGRHTSAVSDNTPPASQRKGDESAQLATKQDARPESKAEARSEPKDAPKQASATGTKPATPSQPSAATTSLVDHVAVPESAEPVVQATVKLLNDLITAINADPESSKYANPLAQAKSQLSGIVSNIASLKEQLKIEAEKKVKDAHSEFDNAAKELVSRLEKEMHEQELRWREEYETERERIAKSYQDKLKAETDSIEKLSRQKSDTALVEQQIALNREFGKVVQERVEQERAGRLGKLEALSSSVEELERLTADWNTVVASNLETQHLHVALESVRSAISRFDHPTPFVAELSALKELGNGNEVVNAAIASIPPVAYQRGIPTPAHLIERFRRVAGEVRKAALLPEDAGVASHAASAVLSKIMFSKKSEGVPIGEDVEAVLTRTETFLEEGDLDGAAREMNGLHGWAGVLSKDWVKECRRVLETKQALDVIATEARLQSLLVD